MRARLHHWYLDQIRPALAASLGRTTLCRSPVDQDCGQHGSRLGGYRQKASGGRGRGALLICGQKPVITKARKSVAGFKLREGMSIGCKVTMRGARMYEFMDRLLTLVLPRVRDFRGVIPKAFDGQGNYSLGLTEYLVFPS